MSKMIIPEVEIEIGENLYLQIKDVSFIPFKKGCTSALPEDSYEDEGADCDWLKENAKLVIKKFEYKLAPYNNPLTGKKTKRLISEKEFPVDDSFVYEYYEQIILQIEEDLQNDR